MENQDWKALREQRKQQEKEFRDNLIKEIMQDYGFNQAIAERVAYKGWEDGHYAGFNEVRTQTQIAADFAEEILKASKE